MSSHPPPPRTIKEPSYLDAIIPLVVLIVLIAGSVYLFGLGAIDGPTQVGLILSTMVAAIIILKNGHPWSEIAASGGRGIALIVSAIFILLAVGALIGTWNMSGTIPTLVPVLLRVDTTGLLFATIVTTAIGLNIVAGDQYIALVLPVRMFRVEFQKRGLQPQNLSRVAADAGTVTSALVPWNSCGAFMSATLGISTFLYLPYAIFNIVSPILSLAYGITGFKIERIPSTTATYSNLE